MDAFALADRMGDGLTHVHLADGTGKPVDEHLMPGKGNQPCAEFLEKLATSNFSGQVILEINTRSMRKPADRVRALSDALLVTRLHLSERCESSPGSAPIPRGPSSS